MSLLGVHRQEVQGPTVLPNLSARPESTGFFQNIGAGFLQTKAGPHSTRNAKAIYESRYYDQIVQALNAEGEHATDMVESPVRADSPFYRPVPGEQRLPDGRVLVPVSRPFTNPFSEAPSVTREANPIANFYLGGDSNEINQMFAAVNRVRLRKPDFLREFKDPQAIDALANQQRQLDLAHAGGVTSRATTLGKVGSFIGGMAASIASLDPENAVGGFASAGERAAGTSIARQIVKRASEGAAINTAAGIVAIPGQEADAEAQGQPAMTAGEIVTHVAENAAAGAIFGTVHAVAPHAAEAAGKTVSSAAGVVAENLPAAVRDPIVAASIRAGTVRDRGLLYEFQRSRSPYSIADTSTPTERAAAHVITSDVEAQEQSPLQPQHAPDNNQRLSAIANSLGVDLTPPDLPSSAPAASPTVRDQAADAPASRRPASFAEATIGAEGRPVRNPASTANGYGQFTEGTWLSVAPHVTNTEAMSRDQILHLRQNKNIAAAATNYYAAQNGRYLRAKGLEDSPGNLSLAHFLGPADAARVLRADPSTPVESIINPKSFAANKKLLEGKSADELIAWAHKRIGAAVDHPPARADAVPDEGFDYSSPVPYTIETLKPDQVTTDAALMQYKSGGDEQGVTDALKGVEQWNPLLSQQILVWEPESGGRIVVDGHQRVGLARRLYADDPTIELPSIVVREADGITAQQARVLGALRNIANGTGTLLDNARVLRDAPDAASILPRNAPLARDSMGLAKLSYEAFGAAVNEVVDPRIAAQVGTYAAHAPEAHMPIIGLLAKERIGSPAEAAAITRQALADGFGTSDAEQLSLLGQEPQQSLYVPIARIMAAATKRLRSERRVFSTLRERAGTIEDAGNVLDRQANEEKVLSNDEALTILDRTAHSAGPVRDALIAAARAELSGTRRADAVSQFLDKLGSIDLRAAAEGLGQDGGAGEPLGGTGRDIAPEAPAADLSGPSEQSLFDTAVAARDAAAPFSDPVGPEAKRQADHIEHDLRATVGAQTAAAGVSEKAVGATYYYDGGSRQRLHSSGSEPAWVPRAGDVALGQFENGIKPGEAAIEVRHVRHNGNDLTWIGAVRPSVDAKFGDRANVARSGVWLKNADIADALPVLKALDELNRWTADPENARDVAQSSELQRRFQQLIDEHVVPNTEARTRGASASHPLLPERAEVEAGSLQEIASKIGSAGDGVTVFRYAPETAERAATDAISPSELASSQGEASPERLHELATENQPRLAQIAAHIAENTGARVKDSGVKSLERIQEKVALEGYDHAGQIKDASRIAFVVDTPEQASRVANEVRSAFPEHADKGVQTIPQSGYTDHKVIVRFGNGGVGEVQIIPEPIYREKYETGTGKLYSQARVHADKAELDRLNAEQKERYAAALADSPFRSWSTNEKSAEGNRALPSASESGTPSVEDLPTNAGASRQPDGFQANARPDLRSDQSTATSRSSTSNNSTFMEEPSGLDIGSSAENFNETDPGLVAKQRQQTEMKAQSPLRSTAEQEGTMGLSLFDATDQPTFRLDEEGNAETLQELLDRADADEAAAQALKDCL